MDFSKIVNPMTNRKARLDTRLGKKVLKQYLARYQQIAGENEPTDVTGQRLHKGDEVYFDKHGEHDDDEENLYVVSDTTAEADCNFKNPHGEVQPCSWMNIAKADDVESDGIDEAESIRTYFPDHEPGDLEDMTGRHLSGYLSKGVVYHRDNKDKVKRHLKQHQKGKLVNKSAATAAHKLLRSNR